MVALGALGWRHRPGDDRRPARRGLPRSCRRTGRQHAAANAAALEAGFALVAEPVVARLGDAACADRSVPDERPVTVLTRGTVVIDVEACKGCDLCIDACQPGVLTMTDRPAQRPRLPLSRSCGPGARPVGPAPRSARTSCSRCGSSRRPIELSYETGGADAGEPTARSGRRRDPPAHGGIRSHRRGHGDGRLPVLRRLPDDAVHRGARAHGPAAARGRRRVHERRERARGGRHGLGRRGHRHPGGHRLGRPGPVAHAGVAVGDLLRPPAAGGPQHGPGPGRLLPGHPGWRARRLPPHRAGPRRHPRGGATGPAGLPPGRPVAQPGPVPRATTTWPTSRRRSTSRRSTSARCPRRTGPSTGPRAGTGHAKLVSPLHPEQAQRSRAGRTTATYLASDRRPAAGDGRRGRAAGRDRAPRGRRAGRRRLRHARSLRPLRGRPSSAQQGLPVGFVRPITLWPFPTEAVRGGRGRRPGRWPSTSSTPARCSTTCGWPSSGGARWTSSAGSASTTPASASPPTSTSTILTGPHSTRPGPCREGDLHEALPTSSRTDQPARPGGSSGRRLHPLADPVRASTSCARAAASRPPCAPTVEIIDELGLTAPGHRASSASGATRRSRATSTSRCSRPCTAGPRPSPPG